MNWAIGLLLTAGFEAALPHFERALQLDPAAPGAHHAFGRALATAGKWDEAIDEYEESLRLEPANGHAHLNLALALRERGRAAAAAVHFETATRLGAGR